MFAAAHSWKTAAFAAILLLSIGGSWASDARFASSKATDQATRAQQEGGGTSQHQASNFVLMPSRSLEKQGLISNGCWSRLYEDSNFAGGAITLTGPQAMPSMVGPFGINWTNRVKSIALCRTAVLTVYDNDSFRQKTSQLEPGTSVAELSKRTGYFDDFASLKIACRT
ncbi:beta/gamma crystallin domain-containing protein [Noviherbaspirillum sp.]|mgnify:CR=1 FL=1|uniref:beta/gamma crystallin domain-containing protein n=1 Tax=Noviherbaspirillum sp. TaxID=1926288 RepID=UPI002FE0AFA4